MLMQRDNGRRRLKSLYSSNMFLLSVHGKRRRLKERYSSIMVLLSVHGKRRRRGSNAFRNEMSKERKKGRSHLLRKSSDYVWLPKKREVGLR